MTTEQYVLCSIQQHLRLSARSLIFFILTETNALNDNIRHRLFV
jgi:hypothetical protein